MRKRYSRAAFRSHATIRPLRPKDRTKLRTVDLFQPVSSTSSRTVAPRSRLIQATMAACFWRTEVDARHRSVARKLAAICLTVGSVLPALEWPYAVGGKGITCSSGRVHSDTVTVSSSNRVRLPTFHTFSLDRSQMGVISCACRRRKGTFG